MREAEGGITMLRIFALFLILPTIAMAQEDAPKRSQFCQDILAGKIDFIKEDTIKYDNSTYKLVEREYGATVHSVELYVVRLDDNKTFYLEEQDRMVPDYNIYSYDGALYASHSNSNHDRYYYRFHPETMELWPVCELQPNKNTFVFTAIKPSPICNQIMKGDYDKLEPISIRQLIENYPVLNAEYDECRKSVREIEHTILSEAKADFKKCTDNINRTINEESSFIHAFHQRCYAAVNEKLCSYDDEITLADYNNDNVTDFIVQDFYAYENGRACAYDYLNNYDDGKFKLITTGTEETHFFYGDNAQNDYLLPCNSGSQELIKIDNTTYLLTKSYDGIDALHRVFTEENGLNNVEEICKFYVQYEYW
jgi:hypothetical protein